jgi:RNA polymerase sigma-70 factor (ECF subfamily)
MNTDTMQDMTFENMVNEYYHEMYGTAYRLTGSQADADDLVQETFKNVLKAVSSGSVIENPRAYLVTTLKNTFYRTLRNAQKEQSAENIEDFIEEHQLDDLNPSAEIDSNEIQQALSKLDQTYRFPLVFFYFNEFSYEEIAELLEIPIGTVMSRLSRGKRYLKLALSGSYEEDGLD